MRKHYQTRHYQGRFLTLIVLFLTFGSKAIAADITIAAAVSLKDALEEVIPALEKAHPGTKIHLTLGASGTVQQQILQGAPIDIFISAAKGPVDSLQAASAILPEARRPFLSNTLIVLGSPERLKGIPIQSFSDLSSNKIHRIAMGEPRSVPAGEYAMDVLKAHKLEEILASQKKLLFAKDVRQVLTYVERGEADLGFVYESDLVSVRLKNSTRLKAILRASKSSHRPIVYEAVLVKRNARSISRRILEDLSGIESVKIWTKYGFKLPAQEYSKESDESLKGQTLVPL